MVVVTISDLRRYAEGRPRGSFGLGAKKKRYRDLSWMKGMISSQDWDRAEKRINEAFETVDKEDWK